MFKTSLLLIFAHTSLPQSIFEQSADDMFKSIIGDVHEYKKKIDPPKTYKELSFFNDMLLSNSSLTNDKMREREENQTKTTQEQRHSMLQVTPLPTIETLNISIDELKLRMRKIHLNKLLESDMSPIPDFSNNADDPAHITRKFIAIAKHVKSQKPLLRQVYIDIRENRHRIYKEKQLTISLMEQFIYTTRYKLPHLQLLRKKYNYHLKYKIGYCFALLRHLKQQQKLIYTTLYTHLRHFNNLMIHMKLYEKIVRLDVDIKDVCTYIRALNFKRQQEDDPDYFKDDDYKKPKPALVETEKHDNDSDLILTTISDL